MNLAVAVLLLIMHPVRETLAEIQHNPDTNRLEIALRLAIEDERVLLRRHVKTRVVDREQTRRAALEVLSEQLRIGTREFIEQERLSPGQRAELSARYHWVGRETEGAHVWWFFELELRDLPADELFVRSELLAAIQAGSTESDHHGDHQTSLSVFLVGTANEHAKRPALTLTPGRVLGKLPSMTNSKLSPQ